MPRLVVARRGALRQASSRSSGDGGGPSARFVREVVASLREIPRRPPVVGQPVAQFEAVGAVLLGKARPGHVVERDL